MDPSIARAVFTSALLRTDEVAPEIKREDATSFTKTLLRTLNICTSREIKACKDFIIRNIIASSARAAALTKYLLFLSKQCAPRSSGSITETSKPREEDEGLAKTADGKLMQPPDAAFKRLHLLYIIHDVLCFVTVRSGDAQHAQHVHYNDAALEIVKAHAGVLAQLATCSEHKSFARSTFDSVQRVLKVWRKLKILDPDALSSIESNCEEASTTSWNDMQQKLAADEAQAALDEQRRREEDKKWILPTQHHLPHDPSAPWHELPAANALFQKRTQGYPLRAGDLPPGGYRLRNGGHQADDALKTDVEELHREALRCFDKYTNADDVRDIDALGNIIWKDRPTRNYWGLEVKS